MRVVCQQPSYFPWLGYFEQIARADAFVYLDQVQWMRQGRQQRTRLPSPAGAQDPFWLTVPVHGQSHHNKIFRDMAIDQEQDWTVRHWRTLRSIYGSAPYFRQQVEPLARPLLERAKKMRFLIELCEASVAAFWEPLGLAAPVWHGSDLDAGGKKSARILGICEALGADEYYSGLGAGRYLDRSLFRAANINLRFQHFRAWALDPRRPCDFSVLDWAAHCEWAEIRSRLGTLETGSVQIEQRRQSLQLEQ